MKKSLLITNYYFAKKILFVLNNWKLIKLLRLRENVDAFHSSGPLEKFWPIYKSEGHSYEKKVLASIASNTYQYFFSYRQSPVKIFFRICSEFFSDFLVLMMLWYIVWYYGMFMKTRMNKRSNKWVFTNVCWWRYANDQRRDSE